jgi:hypothetical protein
MSGPYPRGGDHGSGRRAGRGPGASGWLAAGIIVGIVGLAATVYVALDRPTHSSAPLLGLTRSSTPASSGASARLGGPTASLRTAAMPADHLPATAGAAP